MKLMFEILVKFVSIVLDSTADSVKENCYPKENICKDCISYTYKPQNLLPKRWYVIIKRISISCVIYQANIHNNKILLHSLIYPF